MFRHGYRTIFANPNAKICYGAVFIEGCCVLGLFPFVASFLFELGVTSLSISGLVIAGFAVGGLFYTMSVSRFLPRLGVKGMMISGGLLMGLQFVLVAFGPAWQFQFASFILMGWGFYMLHGSLQVFSSELSVEARATALSLHAFFFFMGQTVGPIAYGFGILNLGKIPTLLASAVVIASVGFGCARCCARPDRRMLRVGQRVLSHRTVACPDPYADASAELRTGRRARDRNEAGAVFGAGIACTGPTFSAAFDCGRAAWRHRIFRLPAQKRFPATPGLRRRLREQEVALSSPPAVGRDALIGNPHALRQLAGLPEHVDRDAAARIPVAADAQPFRLDLGRDALADRDRAVLVERAVIAEAGEIKLQRFGFQQPLLRHIVDHQMREIGLAGDRAERGEFGRCKSRHIIGVRVRIGNAVELRLSGEAGRRSGGRAEFCVSTTRAFSTWWSPLPAD